MAQHTVAHWLRIPRLTGNRRLRGITALATALAFTFGSFAGGSLGPTAAQAATVPISDSTFTNANWMVTKVYDNTPGHAATVTGAAT